MYAYDQDYRRLYAREYAERLKRDAQQPAARRRRLRLRELLERELPLPSAARRRPASPRPS
jgi:hypothetical protein